MTVDLRQRLLAAQARYTNDVPNIEILREICEVLITLKREDELLLWADRALVLNPDSPIFGEMRAFSLDLLGRHAEAADAWARDSSLSGNKPVIHRLRLGYSLMMSGDLARAIPILDEAREMATSSSTQIFAATEHLLGEAMLKTGDPRGFAYWLTRNKDPASAGSYCPVGIQPWAGENDLRGRRVLITHQLGFGDNFLLAACVADWIRAGARMMISCDPEIQALMQASLPECEVVSAPRPLGLNEVLPDDMLIHVDAFAPDLHATLLHLPLLNAGRETSGYRFSPYIQAPRAKQIVASEWARQLRAQYPQKKLVGVFWDCEQRHWPEAGSAARCWATRRSLPLDAVNWLVTNHAVADCVHFVNLHHPHVEAAAGTPISNVSRYLPGFWHFDDTAACIEQLDAVVAVDSGVSNLASMMGVPTCVPVNTSGDWRWGSCGTTSPWISDVTVLRQTQEGDWSSVIRSIASWLMQELRRRDLRQRP